MGAPREELHRLVDELPERAVEEACEYLRRLLALESVPVDDEPLTPEEDAALAEAMQDVRAGRVRSWDQVRDRHTRKL